jgi:protein gp37
MSEHSAIEWTDATWNPVRGCTKVSPGCAHCYAETFAERFRGVPGHPYEQGFDLRLVPEKLGEPLKWRKPRMVFVNSMSDLFHKDVPDRYIAAVFGVMSMCPQHTFQVLTKRAERLPRWFDWLKREYNGPCEQNAVLQTSLGDYFTGSAPSDEVFEAMLDADWPLPNVWLGVSVEDQRRADERIPHLLKTPAAVRFLSVEPMLSEINVKPYLRHKFNREPHCDWCEDCIPDSHGADWWKQTRADRHGPFVDWVIVGGESGPGARPMHPDWARKVRDDCVAAGVPFFFKQWGGTNKKATGRVLDGRTWEEFPCATKSSFPGGSQSA